MTSTAAHDPEHRHPVAQTVPVEDGKEGGEGVVHDILELFNADDLIDAPDEHHEPPSSPVTDADVPAPPG